MGTATHSATGWGPKKILQMAITHGIPLLIFLIPGSETYTREIKIFVAVTTWLLLWAAFSISDLFLPSIMWPALLVFFNALPMNVVYSPWITLIPPVVFATFMLANVLEEIGLLQRVALFIVRKTGGTYNGTVWGIFIACTILSVITFGSACIPLAALCYGVCKTLNLKGKKEGAILMMAGMVGVSTIRGTIYYPAFMGALIGSARTVKPDFNVDIFGMFFHNIPMLAYCALFVWLMMLFGKTKSSSIGAGKAFFDEEYKKLGPMSGKEKKASILLAALMFFILLSPWHGKDPMFAFIFIPALMFFPGIDLASSRALSQVNIGVIFFVASCMAIGAGCVNLKLTTVIANELIPMLQAMGANIFLIGVLTFGIILKFMMTPMAMLAGFSGILVDISQKLNFNSLTSLYTFNFATDLVILPYEYVTFLIFFSFGIMTVGQFMKYHTMKILFFCIFYVLVVLPYWKLIHLL